MLEELGPFECLCPPPPLFHNFDQASLCLPFSARLRLTSIVLYSPSSVRIMRIGWLNIVSCIRRDASRCLPFPALLTSCLFSASPLLTHLTMSQFPCCCLYSLSKWYECMWCMRADSQCCMDEAQPKSNALALCCRPMI